MRNDGKLAIGDDVVISSTPVTTHLVTGHEGFLQIGNRVEIGHGGAVACLEHIIIEDDAVIGAFVAIMDSDFHVAGDGAAAPRPRPITIGRGAKIGHRAIILPGSHIADGAIVESASVVSGTIHPGARVAGNPAVLLTSSVSTGASDDVRDLVARVFSLADRPDVLDGPHNIPGWDSLGALQLLIEVEATFGIVLDDEVLANLRTVGDLERRVNHSRGSAPSVVRGVVARVFGLSDPPDVAARPQDIAGWDSLGMLELVLAVESTFGISLDERHLANVKNVGDLEHLVSQLSS
ncbi:MAG: hypothetical protein QOD72_1489 [Acidimicrobiaceae bacterium]|nr:hypothetical protein [Acidimicrobiaceae bacterium]